MMTIDIEQDAEDTKFFSDLKLGPIVYFWKGDLGEDFTYVDLNIQSVENIENAYNLFKSFTPIAPLSMRFSTGCSIVRGKDHEYLYLMQSPSKSIECQNNVDIIDPMIGKIISYDIELFAAKQADTEVDNFTNLIEPEQSKQFNDLRFRWTYY